MKNQNEENEKKTKIVALKSAIWEGRSGLGVVVILAIKLVRNF